VLPKKELELDNFHVVLLLLLQVDSSLNKTPLKSSNLFLSFMLVNHMEILLILDSLILLWLHIYSITLLNFHSLSIMVQFSKEML